MKKAMSDQERSSQQLQEEERICRSMLHLSTASDPQSSAAAVSRIAITAPPAYDKPTKRHPSSSQFQEPLRKRASLHHPSPPFINLPLAVSLPVRSPAPLRRTVSAPVSPPVATFTPLGPPVGSGDSPSCKRFKRMKERLREMSKWWDSLLNEEDNDEDGEGQTQIHESLRDQTLSTVYGGAISMPKMLNKGASEHEEDDKHALQAQEAVWVDKIREYLSINFKCPCGKGYEVLLSGNDCYYKLTNF